MSIIYSLFRVKAASSLSQWEKDKRARQESKWHRKYLGKKKKKKQVVLQDENRLKSGSLFWLRLMSPLVSVQLKISLKSTFRVQNGESLSAQWNSSSTEKFS